MAIGLLTLAVQHLIRTTRYGQLYICRTLFPVAISFSFFAHCSFVVSIMKCFVSIYKNCLLLVLFLTASPLLWAQQITVKGKVIDAQSANPLPAATIQLYVPSQSKPVQATAAKEGGLFSALLPPGRYFAVVQYTGYRPDTTAFFDLTDKNTGHDLGLIKLLASATTLQEVTVQAERSYMQLALDKKIFSVGQDLANAGGTATDVLTNIPSVTVDAEGGVKLRGSDNVRILIDGKPSGLVSIKGSGQGSKTLSIFQK